MPPGTRRVDESAGEIGYASALVLSEDRTLDERPDEPGLLDEMIGRNFVAWRDDLRRVGAGTDGNELVGHGDLGLIQAIRILTDPAFRSWTNITQREEAAGSSDLAISCFGHNAP